MTDQEKAEQWVAANRVRIELGADHHAVASLVVLIEKVRVDERERVVKGPHLSSVEHCGCSTCVILRAAEREKGTG